MQTRRVLSIDGGGIKGLFPASFLATIEASIGTPVTQHFDLIVGTSTGGIIALALGLGFSASNILGFYERLGPAVFGTSALVGLFRKLKQVGSAKYSQTALRAALVELFGERTIGESTSRLVIPSFNLETGEIYVFKTRHVARYERDYREKAVDVALATGSAPTYFPTHRNSLGTPLIDGGIWANNPIGVAAIEAVSVLGWEPETVRILSLGCTSEAFDLGLARNHSRGFLYWGTKVAELFMTGQSSAAVGVAANLVGHGNIQRINPVVPAKRFSLDGIREVESLRGLGASEARKALPNIRPIFFTNPAEPFIPATSHQDVS